MIRATTGVWINYATTVAFQVFLALRYGSGTDASAFVIVFGVAIAVGGVVTASAQGTAQVWDAATGKSLSPPFVHHESVKSSWFSPDGARVVTASSDRTAQVWDAASGEPALPRSGIAAR